MQIIFESKTPETISSETGFTLAEIKKQTAMAFEKLAKQLEKFFD